MLRTCSKRLIPTITMMGLAALALVGAGCASVPASPATPIFARIVLSEKSVVYIQVQDAELRAAMSVEGLQAAQPIKSHDPDLPMFSDVALPVPADQLPACVTAIKVSLLRDESNPWSNLRGQLTVCRTDDRKAEWQYVSQVDVLAMTTAEKAPSITLPNLDKLKVSLETVPSDGKLGAGLRLTAGDVVLTEVRKDGQSVRVKMVVTNASGAEIASDDGALTDFGFS